MDRAYLVQLLAKADEHVAKAKEHVQQQRKIAAELERDGHDATLAKQVLAQFESLLNIQMAERDRLATELSHLSK